MKQFKKAQDVGGEDEGLLFYVHEATGKLGRLTRRTATVKKCGLRERVERMVNYVFKRN